MIPEYRKIDYFLKVAEHRNLKKAADELYITPQALSKQMMSLEETVGAQLLVRSNSGISLTQEGKRMVEVFSGLYRQVNRTWEQYLDDINRPAQEVRIGFYRGLPEIAVISFVTEYLIQNAPELRIELNGYDIKDAMTSMLTGKTDLVITNIHSDEAPRENCELIHLAGYPAKIIVGRTHPWARDPSLVTVENVVSENIIGYRDWELPADMDTRLMTRIRDNGHPQKIIYAEDGEAIMQKVILQQGYVVRPVYAVKQYADKIAILDLPEEMRFNIDIVLGYRKNHPKAALFDKMRGIELIL